jgi:hypothetical protein
MATQERAPLADMQGGYNARAWRDGTTGEACCAAAPLTPDTHADAATHGAQRAQRPRRAGARIGGGNARLAGARRAGATLRDWRENTLSRGAMLTRARAPRRSRRAHCGRRGAGRRCAARARLQQALGAPAFARTCKQGQQTNAECRIC